MTRDYAYSTSFCFGNSNVVGTFSTTTDVGTIGGHDHVEAMEALKKEHQAEVARSTEERDRYKKLWKQVSAIGPTGDYVRADDHVREVAKLQRELNALQQRIEEAKAAGPLPVGWTHDVPSIPEPAVGARGEVIRLDGCGRADGEWVRRGYVDSLWEENLALRAQLALAEEKRRPARHRPGGDVQVGWDPEGD